MRTKEGGTAPTRKRARGSRVGRRPEPLGEKTSGEVERGLRGGFLLVWSFPLRCCLRRVPEWAPRRRRVKSRHPVESVEEAMVAP